MQYCIGHTYEATYPVIRSVMETYSLEGGK